MDNGAVVNVVGTNHRGGDVWWTRFVLNRGGHDVATITCADLFNTWSKNGTMQHSIANDAAWQSQGDNLSITVEGLDSRRGNRLALITFYVPNAYDYWFVSYLVRFDSKPNFSIVPLREMQPGPGGRPRIVSSNGGVILVTNSDIQRLNAFGQPIGKPLHAKDGMFFKFAHDHRTGVFIMSQTGQVRAQDVFVDLASMSYLPVPVSQRLRLGDGLFVNVAGLGLDTEVGDVKKTRLVLNRGGHDLAAISCLDLYKTWSSNGTITNKVWCSNDVVQYSATSDTSMLFGSNDLGIFAEGPILGKAGKSALIMFGELGEGKDAWREAYLVRIQLKPKFAVVPLWEITPDPDMNSKDRPRIIVSDGNAALVTMLYIQPLSVSGVPIGNPIQAKNRTFFKYVSGHQIDIYKKGYSDERVKGVVFDIADMRFHPMPVSQQQGVGIGRKREAVN